MVIVPCTNIIKLGSPPGGGLGHQEVTRQPRLQKNGLFLKAIAVGTSIFRGCKKGVGRARILSVRPLRSKCGFLRPPIPERWRQNERTRIQSQTVSKEKTTFFCSESRRGAKKVFFSNRSASPCPDIKITRFLRPIPQR